MSELLGLLGKLGQLIVDEVQAGRQTDEILARIAKPDGVLAEIIDNIRKRKRQAKIDDYIANG